MTAKEFLTQAYRIEDRIASLKRQLEAIYSPRGQTYNNIGGRASENVSITEQQAIKGSKINDILQSEIARLEQVQIDVHNSISELVNINEQLVLRYKYIERFSWEVISYKMGYCDKQVKRIHGKALEHLKF